MSFVLLQGIFCLVSIWWLPGWVEVLEVCQKGHDHSTFGLIVQKGIQIMILTCPFGTPNAQGTFKTICTFTSFPKHASLCARRQRDQILTFVQSFQTSTALDVGRREPLTKVPRWQVSCPAAAGLRLCLGCGREERVRVSGRGRSPMSPCHRRETKA